MAKYTIEDIEIIRQKSGLSYEEAVNLLEYHNGSLARALVDLEKNGRLKDTKNSARRNQNRGTRIANYLYRTRLKVKKDQIQIVNLSVIFVVFSFMVAPWLVAIGLVLAIALGYRISVDKSSKEFSSDYVEDMVKKATTNVKKTVYTVVSEFDGRVKEEEEDEQEEQAPEAPQYKPEARAENAASGTTPVNVQFPDGGSVEVKFNDDGFHEADIQ